MKLFLYCDSLAAGKGGAERIFTHLGSAMTKRGHQVYIGFRGPGSPAYPQYPDVSLVPFIASKNTVSKYRKQIKAIDPDLFFVFYFNATLKRDWRFCPDGAIPFGMQECSNPDRIRWQNWSNTTKRRAFSAWERELLASSAARIRMVMPGYEQSFSPYIRQQVRAFPNPAPENSGQAELNPPDNAPKRIITIGGQKQNKNLPLLVKAFSNIAELFPDWQIHNFGAPLDTASPFHRELLRLTRDLKLENRIVFHPPTVDIFSEYCTSQIHAIPSLQEGCPTCVLEAMAHGLPSIGIDTCPGTNVLIRHGHNGLLTANDPDKMAAALQQMMGDSDLRTRLGVQAYQDSKMYQQKETYDKWEKLFYEIAEYKNDPHRLIREQMAVDRERALHMARCRRRLLEQEIYK